MAGGEYQVDDYYEMIKKQMKKIRGNLKKIEIERGIRRRHRKTGGFYILSLAGYTNAGKSSLLNILSGDEVNVDGRLFSTLSTTTRRLKDEDVPILVTDTVGFIEDLPAWIINAFHSTLEEIELADIVLLVVDISDNFKDLQKKISVAINELIEIGVNSPIIIILNKIDLILQDDLISKIRFVRDMEITKGKNIITISAKNKENIDELYQMIYDTLPYSCILELQFPINDDVHSFISSIYKKSIVLKINSSMFSSDFLA